MANALPPRDRRTAHQSSDCGREASVHTLVVCLLTALRGFGESGCLEDWTAPATACATDSRLKMWLGSRSRPCLNTHAVADYADARPYMRVHGTEKR